VLKLERVQAGDNGMPVLFAIDVEGREGEAVAILGANGAGKSTFLRVITDLSVRRAGP